MTEDEARTKKCCGPLILAAVGVLAKENIIPTSQMLNCIGAGCMAWRWAHTSREDGRRNEYTNSTTNGFCGLAGQQ